MMNGELLCKVIQRVKVVARIEAFLILTVAALEFAIVPRRIRADQLVPDAQFGGCLFKQRRQITFTVGKIVRKLNTVVCLHTLYLDAAACVPRRQSAKKVCRRISRLLRIGSEKSQTAELINSGVLKQAKIRICDAAVRNDLYVHLNALSGMAHLLIMLWFVSLFGPETIPSLRITRNRFSG